MHPGVLSATLAYVLWGLFPLYFRPLAAVDAFDVVVHRIVWSAAFLLIVLAVLGRWGWLRDVLRRPKVLGAFAASALLLSGNWLVYVWAVANGHVVEASLGYFITPLVNVMFGSVLLHERLRPVQWTAVALAAAGVLWLAVQGGRLPWVALALAATFGTYGLLRKTAALGALEGLALETMLLAPIALAALAGAAWRADGALFPPAADGLARALLIGLGPVTVVPLLLFAAGARRIRMATLGLLQYLAPSLQLALGIALFHEAFPAARAVGFGFIWAALAVYSVDGWRAGRQPA